MTQQDAKCEGEGEGVGETGPDANGTLATGTTHTRRPCSSSTRMVNSREKERRISKILPERLENGTIK